MNKPRVFKTDTTTEKECCLTEKECCLKRVSKDSLVKPIMRGLR